MANCITFKKISGYGWNNSNKPQPIRSWYAECPECGEHILGGTQFYSQYRVNSRKTAKDALHIHLKKKHQ